MKIGHSIFCKLFAICFNIGCNLPSAMRKENALVEIITIASLCLGIAIRRKQKSLELPYMVVFSFCFTMAAIFATIDFLLSEKTRAEKFEVVYTMNAATSVLSVFFVAKMNTYLLTKLHRSIEKFSDQYEGFTNFSNKLSSEIMNQFRLLLLFTYIPVITIPLIMTFAADVEFGNTKSLIFRSWYPWNTNSLLGYLLTVFVQLTDVTFGYLIVIAIISCLISCVICVFTLIRLFEKRLQKSFKALSSSEPAIQSTNDPSSNYCFKSNDEEWENYMQRELTSVIYLHQTIMK